MGGSLYQDDIIARADCPVCGARRGTWCDGAARRRERDRRAGLEVSGPGQSHFARMLVAYGRSPEAALRVTDRMPAERGSMDQLATGLAACPRHHVAAGVPCPGGGACPARRGAAAAAAARGRRQVRPATRYPAVPVRPTSSVNVLEPVNGPGGDAGFRRWWCLVMWPPTRELAVSGPDGRAALRKAAGRA